MKKFLFILAAVALASCSSNEKSSTTKDSTATKSDSTAKETVTTPATPWQYETDTDKMTSKVRSFAMVTATNKLEFDFPYKGGSTGVITIRTNDKENEVVLTIDKGQFLGGEDHPVSVKFDGDAPLQFSANEPSDGKATVLFLHPAKKFISRIKTAKKMMVQAEFYESGQQVMEFDVAGLKWDH